MTSRFKTFFDELPTPWKLMLMLSAAVLPLVAVLIWSAQTGIRQAQSAVVDRADDMASDAARAVDTLIARRALSLRVAVNGALQQERVDPCLYTAGSLAAAQSAVRFTVRNADGLLRCTYGNFVPQRGTLLVPPGQMRLWISPGADSIYFRVGVPGGMGTSSISSEELRAAIRGAGARVDALTLHDNNLTMHVFGDTSPVGRLEQTIERRFRIAGGQLEIATETRVERVSNADLLFLLLPLMIWLVASAMVWMLINRLIVQPLRNVQQAVSAYEPGSGTLELPRRVGPTRELRELGQSFSRAVERIEESEKDMAIALEGQRKLVREVHHRVKNNLQVVASLLNIHGRSATSPDARDAYSSIGRRVDALAVVHRNHYAELEENRGIALRPLLSELAASLRSSAPESVRGFNIDLDLEALNTTQDVAVAAAFFVTEIVEFAMLHRPEEPVRLTLRRSGELTARFILASAALTPNEADDPERRQFERIVAGLAKQLRSTLDKQDGSYAVDLPVYPPTANALARASSPAVPADASD